MRFLGLLIATSAFIAFITLAHYSRTKAGAPESMSHFVARQLAAYESPNLKQQQLAAMRELYEEDDRPSKPVMLWK